MDPTTDSTGSNWVLLEVQGPPGETGPPGNDADVPLASTSVAGKVESATEQDGENDGERAVTRLLLKQLGYLTLAEANQRFVVRLQFSSSISNTSRNANTTYSVTLPAASGGTSPYTYSATAIVTAVNAPSSLGPPSVGTEYTLDVSGRTVSLALEGTFISPGAGDSTSTGTYKMILTAQVDDGAGAITNMDWELTVNMQIAYNDDD